MKTIYLATPYSHKFKFIRNLRYNNVTKVAAKIMDQYGHNVFSPITHSHPIAVLGNLPALDHEFWLRLDKWYVDRCDELWVYTQHGWRTSTGVRREVSWAYEEGKKVYLVNKYGNTYVRKIKLLTNVEKELG